MTRGFAGDSATRRWALHSALVAAVMIVCFIAGNVFSTLDATGALPNAPTGFVQCIANHRRLDVDCDGGAARAWRPPGIGVSGAGF